MATQPTQIAASSGDDLPTLTISTEKVCFVIIKAREFDVKDAVTEPNAGSNPSSVVCFDARDLL